MNKLLKLMSYILVAALASAATFAVMAFEPRNGYDKLDELRIAYDTIVAKDQGTEQFKVILNTLMNLYEASKPEVFEKKW